MLGLWLLVWAPVQYFLANLTLTFLHLPTLPAPEGIRDLVRRSVEGAWPSPWVILFLSLFTVAWLYPGVHTITYVLRAHFGSDHLSITDDAIRARRTLGPFGITREVKRDEIRSIVLHGRDRRIDATLIGGNRVRLASLGSDVDRRRIVTELRQRFRRPRSGGLPPGWTMLRKPDGTVSLRGPHGDHLYLVGCFVFCTAVWWGLIGLTIYLRGQRGESLAPTVGNWIAIGMGMAMIAIVVLVARMRNSIEVRPNEIVTGRQTYRDATLKIAYQSTAKYGDMFQIEIQSGRNWTFLVPRSNDPTDLLLLARFLAGETRWKLEIAPEAE